MSNRRFVLLIIPICFCLSCTNGRYHGKHNSIEKELELKANSNFNERQAQEIVGENQKNRGRRMKKAEQKRQSLNEKLEKDSKDHKQEHPAHHINEGINVPSYP